MSRNLKEMTGIKWLIKDLHALHNGMAGSTKHMKETLEIMDAEKLWGNLEFYRKLMVYVDHLQETRDLYFEVTQFVDEERLRQLKEKLNERTNGDSTDS